jgi:GNAT superfamily N-acetyltransferase
MYARVLRGGHVRRGDPIDVQPPDGGSEALTHLLLNRIEALEQFSDVSRWEAAVEAGHPVAILDRGDLYAGTSNSLTGPAFNNAGGLRTLPHHLERVLDHFRRHGSGGWFPFEASPWPAAGIEWSINVFVRATSDLPEPNAPSQTDVAVRRVDAADAAEAEAFADLYVRASENLGAEASAWRALLPRLLRSHGHHAVIAEMAGRPVGVGLLVTRGRTGLLRAATVLPDGRGHGVQLAMIAARVAIARELNVDLIAATAAPTNDASVRNLETAGLEPIWRRDYYRFDPAADAATLG